MANRIGQYNKSKGFKGVWSMSVAEEIERLNELKTQGAISDEEFQKLKALELDAASASNHELEYRNWAMFIHLSQLFGYLVTVNK